MSMNITAVPTYVWIGAAAVIIILIGWFFNVWRVIGIKDSFPYLEITKPLPELHSLEPQALLSGESLTLHGDKFEAFDPKSSRIVIGAALAEIINWDRKNLDGACLLCSEDQPHHCHRRLVAEYLKDKWGDINIVHL